MPERTRETPAARPVPAIPAFAVYVSFGAIAAQFSFARAVTYAGRLINPAPAFINRFTAYFTGNIL
jgi:hypothetical protein